MVHICRYVWGHRETCDNLVKGLNHREPTHSSTTMTNAGYLFPWKYHIRERIPSFPPRDQLGQESSCRPRKHLTIWNFSTNLLFHSLAVRASVTKRQISAHGIACSNKQTTNDVPLESLASFERVSFMLFTSATTRGRQTPKNNS